MARKTTVGNLGLEIPGGDPVLNERMRRIGIAIEQAANTGGTSATVATASVDPNSASTVIARVSDALFIVDQVLGVKPGGITTDLIRQFAVSNDRIAHKADGTLALTDLRVDVGQIKLAAITTLLAGTAAITDAMIGSLSVIKLTAGTIAVAVTLTAPTLVISGGLFTINLDAVNGFRLTRPSTSQYLQMNDAQVRVGSTFVSDRAATVTVGGFQASWGGSNGIAQLIVQSGFAALFLGNTGIPAQVVGARRTGWVTPTGIPIRNNAFWNTATVSLPDLARAVKAVIDDLISHGLIGA